MGIKQHSESTHLYQTIYPAYMNLITYEIHKQGEVALRFKPHCCSQENLPTPHTTLTFQELRGNGVVVLCVDEDHSFGMLLFEVGY